MSSCPRSVLAAVDFGEASGCAVALAGAIAQRCGAASFTLLHAESIDAPPYFTHDQVAALEQQRRQVRHDAELALTRFGRRHTDVPFASVIEYRNAVDAILSAAAAVDLVVMGTHGRTGPQRWWLGSAAERVIHSITTPIAIARTRMPTPIDTAFSRIVAHAEPPLDGADALRWAADLAAAFGTDAIDARHAPISDVVTTHRATLVVAATPLPQPSEWLSHRGEPLIRWSTIPVVLVPEPKGRPK